MRWLLMQFDLLGTLAVVGQAKAVPGTGDVAYCIPGTQGSGKCALAEVVQESGDRRSGAEVDVAQCRIRSSWGVRIVVVVVDQMVPHDAHLFLCWESTTPLVMAVAGEVGEVGCCTACCSVSMCWLSLRVSAEVVGGYSHPFDDTAAHVSRT